MSKLTGSIKATQFTESVIREMTRVSTRCYGGVNLSQGFPGLCRRPKPSRKRPARRFDADVNQYAVTWGARALRDADRREFTAALRRAGRRRRAGHGVLRRDGSDDGDDDGDHRSGRRGDRLRAVLRELRSRRDPVRRDTALRHARELTLGTWTFDPDELAAAFNNRTKAIILNTPNNPTGKVFSRDGARDDRGAVPEVGRRGDLRRDLRAHHLRRPRPRADCRASMAWPIAR